MSLAHFQPADYLVCGLTLVMAILGLFRGFSGTLGFGLGVAGAAFVATFGWGYSASLTAVLWMRVAGTLVATLVSFGVIRMIVRKLVNGLLAQPSDALFGFLIGASFGVLLLVAWACSGVALSYSFLAQTAASFLH